MEGLLTDRETERDNETACRTLLARSPVATMTSSPSWLQLGIARAGLGLVGARVPGGLGPESLCHGPPRALRGLLGTVYLPLRQNLEGKTLITCILLDLPSFIFPYVQMN